MQREGSGLSVLRRRGRLGRGSLLLVLAAVSALVGASWGLASGERDTDPALDPAAWRDASIEPVDCHAGTDPGAECFDAVGFPEGDPLAPITAHERKVLCQTAELEFSASHPICAGFPIPPQASQDFRGEAQRYGFGQSFAPPRGGPGGEYEPGSEYEPGGE